MKIAFVRARYNPFGGAERFAARAMTALAAERERPVNVAILARSWSGLVEGDAVGGRGARLVRCDPPYVGSVWRDASFAAAVRRHLRRERFDLVQSHERIVGLPIYRAGDGVHAAWLERRGRAASPMTRLGIALNPHHRYLVRVEKAMFEHPALRVVICNSTMVRDEIAVRFRIDPDRLVLIRNGVDLDRFHPSARDIHRHALRERLGIADATTVLLMVGSGFERKGVGAALEALAACPEAVLVVVGDDKHRQRYEARAVALRIADRVHFVGPTTDPLPFHAMADCFVAPTLYDPFPNAALEALACGLPVVTTDACGIAELIVDGRNGWVVPSHDVDALTVALQRAIAVPVEARHGLRDAARRTAEPYSLAALSTALIGLYRRLLDPSTPR